MDTSEKTEKEIRDLSKEYIESEEEIEEEIENEIEEISKDDSSENMLNV